MFVAVLCCAVAPNIVVTANDVQAAINNLKVRLVHCTLLTSRQQFCQ